MSTKELNQTKQHCNAPLDLEGIKMSEKEIIRSVQRRYFREKKKTYSPWERENA